MYNIRAFNRSQDVEMIQQWCKAYGESAPTSDIIPDSSFVLEMDGTPALFLSLIKTNTPICYFENFCGNPEFKGKRSEAVPALIAHIEAIAKSEGFKGIITYSMRPKLTDLFESYGFKQACVLAALCRSIT